MIGTTSQFALPTLIALLALLGAPLAASLLSRVATRMAQLRGIALAAAGCMLSAAAVLFVAVAHYGAYSVPPFLSVDPLGAFFILIVSVVGAAAWWHSTAYLAAEVEKGILGFRRVRQYFTLLPLFLFAMLFASSTSNPILMWVAIEGTTLSTAFLISLYNKPSALEAAWKYLMLNSVGLLLAFFGTLIISYQAIAASAGFVEWQGILATAPTLDPTLVEIAFIFIVIGYGTKIGFVPMHTWLPDAHSKAPAPVSALLSGVLLNVAFLGLLRFKVVADASLGPEFSSSLLMMFGVISMLVAALLIFVQKSYKRLLAYSSIEHMGIAALGFGFGGAGAAAALLHMLYHALGKSLLFLSAGNIFLRYSSTKIAHVRGMLHAMPTTAVLFMIGFLAITGVPPFGTFLTEFAILTEGMSAHPIFALAALAAIVFVFVGFFRHLSSMFFDTVPAVAHDEVFARRERMSLLAPIAALALALIVLSVFLPPTLQTLIATAVAVY